MRSKITITIKGAEGHGKTHFFRKIKNLLEEEGFAKLNIDKGAKWEENETFADDANRVVKLKTKYPGKY